MRSHTRLVGRLALGILGAGLAGTPAIAQEAESTGLEIGAIPAIGFDSDEGFGYGGLVNLYQYGLGVWIRTYGAPLDGDGQAVLQADGGTGLRAPRCAPVVAVACVSANATLIDPTATPYPSMSPDSVVIYTSMAELEDLEYERIAIIDASGSGDLSDQVDMLEAMREKAGEVGANGLLLPEIEEPGAGARVAAAVFGTDTTRTGSAVAIRVIRPADPD